MENGWSLFKNISAIFNSVKPKYKDIKLCKQIYSNTSNFTEIIIQAKKRQAFTKKMIFIIKKILHWTIKYISIKGAFV